MAHSNWTMVYIIMVHKCYPWFYGGGVSVEVVVDLSRGSWGCFGEVWMGGRGFFLNSDLVSERFKDGSFKGGG